jgi:hypothetical protein
MYYGLKLLTTMRGNMEHKKKPSRVPIYYRVVVETERGPQVVDYRGTTEWSHKDIAERYARRHKLLFFEDARVEPVLYNQK